MNVLNSDLALLFLFVWMGIDAQSTAAIFKSVDAMIAAEDHAGALELLIASEKNFKSEEESLALWNNYLKQFECHQELKKVDAAIADLDKIIDGANVEEHLELIREAHQKKGDYCIGNKRNVAIAALLEFEVFEKKYGDNNALAQCFSNTGSMYQFFQKNEKAALKFEAGIKVVTDDKLKAQLYHSKADALRNTSTRDADSLFQITLGLIAKIPDSIQYFTTYNRYGNFLIGQGRQEEALNYLMKGMDYMPIDPKMDFPRMINYTSISQLFYGLGNDARGDEYILAAIAIGDKNNYKARNGFTAVIYGETLVEKGKYQAAEEELQKAKVYLKQRKIYPSYLECLSVLGGLEVLRGNLTVAKEILAECDEVLKIPEMNFRMQKYHQFASIYWLEMNNPQRSIQSANSGLTLCIEVNKPSCVMRMHEHLKLGYEQAKNFELAMKHFDAYVRLKDSIFQSNQNDAVFELESRYKRSEQDKSIALLDLQNEMKSEKLSKQQGVIAIGGIALALISLLSFFLFSLYKRINKQKAVIQKALTEKDTLLREIHHRVKNNLQLVSSLLTLQSRSISDKTAIAAINEGKARVRSMALIHQNLYNRENLTGISVKDYIEKLCDEIFNIYNIQPDQVQLQLNIEELELDVDTVVPLGLIINELLTNALKYAFEPGKAGLISISLKMQQGKLHLQIKDNGVGVDPTIFESKSSFGNRLVTILTDQLEGELNVSSEKGTTIDIKFAAYAKAA